MRIHVDASEVRALAAEFEADAAKAAMRANIAVRKTAADLERDAKILAPVDTGFLQGSITTTITSGPTFTEAVQGPTANYGHYVEGGTSRMEPQPFMGPAFDRNAPKLAQALGQV